jgi:hypothetical protein
MTTTATDDTVQDPRVGLVDVADPIDRTDFGLTASRGMAGRHLDVSLRILGVRR